MLESRLHMALGSHLSRFLHQIRLLMSTVISPYTTFWVSDSCIYLSQSWNSMFIAQDFETTKEKCYNFRPLPHTSTICSSPAKFTFQHKPRKKCATLFDNRVEDAPSFSFLKILLTSGFFTFLTTQQALAGSDIASSLQSFPFLGDAGDLSTGFASVRKFSL